MNRTKEMLEEIKTNLWYAIDCKQCYTWFLLERSADGILPPAPEAGIKKETTFIATCPRCKAENKVKATGRIVIKYVRTADDDELYLTP